MTNEEAKRRIEICRDFLANNYSDMGEPNFMAFDMAIKALEQKPNEQIMKLQTYKMFEGEDTVYVERDDVLKALEQEPCEDAISRQAVSKLLNDGWIKGIYPQDAIMALPSVTPKFTDAEIQKMQELEQAQLEKAYELGRAEVQPCNDCISREAAIDALWKALYEYEDKTEKQFLESEELDVANWFQHRIFVQNMSDIDRQTILNLPSVTPKASKD